jgi:GTP-binding protein
MRTFSTKFLTAAPNAEAFPPTGPPEVAVVGRSNVGKSTLINTLVGQRGVARVSRKPGRTRAINFFEVENSFLLVDLPGYGYASGPREEVASWRKLVESYLRGSRPIRGVVALFDARRKVDELDLALVGMLRDCRLNWQAVWTKTDKLKRAQLSGKAAELDRRLATPKPGILFSSKNRQGRDALLEWMQSVISS